MRWICSMARPAAMVTRTNASWRAARTDWMSANIAPIKWGFTPRKRYWLFWATTSLVPWANPAPLPGSGPAAGCGPREYRLLWSDSRHGRWRPHVAAADEAKGIFHGNHSCLWSMDFLGPRIWRSAGRNRRDCFYSSIGQQGRQGRGSVGSGKFLVRIGKGEGRRTERFVSLAKVFLGKTQRYLRHKKR